MARRRPTTYRITCDHPISTVRRCDRYIDHDCGPRAYGPTPSDLRAAISAAEVAGWQFGPAASLPYDKCPAHRDRPRGAARLVTL